jgi:RNA polymerase sigma-70 factor (ECF subfamily)
MLRDWREIPSETVERLEVHHLLHNAVADLPAIYREIFRLRDVEELSISEAAETLGITAASVKVRLHRARIMLQKTLISQLKQINPKRRCFPW